jgi:hypothetical protein
MIHHIVRLIKRFVVLVPGVVIAYFSVRDIYPALDSKIPAGVAFFITYVLAAYVLIPAGIRLVRLFVKPRHLPIYSVTPDGFASDPVNVGIIGTRDQLEQAMQKAGWETADQHTVGNIYREIISVLFHQPYPTAPMSSLYLMGRKQDLGFEIQVEERLGHRHHVRFWATTFREDGNFTNDDIHWFHRKKIDAPEDTQFLWLGAASKDVGLALIKHNAQLTHMIHPDTNRERDLIVDHLLIDGAKLEATLQIRHPYRLANRAWSGYLQSDGQLKIVRLKQP